MTPVGRTHYCSCGSPLARDNRTGRCGACRTRDRERFLCPPALDAEFWAHPEIRAALTSRHFGRVLRAYRCHPAHGRNPLAQEVVATWLNITQSRLSRIENGPAPHDLDRLIAWAQLLGIPERLLWFRLSADVPPRRGHGAPSSAHPSVAAGSPPATVGIDDLGALQSLRMADRRVGGSYLYATVTNYLQHAVAPRLFGGAIDSTGHSVFAAAAGLTEMAGWMAHDAGRDSLAEQHFRQALGLAHVGKDHQVACHVLGSLSHLSHHTKRSAEAVAYATEGREHLTADHHHPSIEARLLAMQARGHAAGGEHSRCVRRLHQAEQLLSTTPSEALSPWVSTFDEASLATEAARCFQELGQPSAARRQAEKVIALRAHERTRSRAFAQLILIAVLVAERKPDEACGMAYEVLATTQALGSYLVVQQLADLEQMLAPYIGDRDVAAFVQHLRGELRERRWLAQSVPPVRTALAAETT